MKIEIKRILILSFLLVFAMNFVCSADMTLTVEEDDIDQIGAETVQLSGSYDQPILLDDDDDEQDDDENTQPE